MEQRTLKISAFRSVVFLVALGGVSQAQTSYSSMAALDQYLIPNRDAEIALARSAAPDSISQDAKILVLGPHGYETAVEGKNGFVCVLRSRGQEASQRTLAHFRAQKGGYPRPATRFLPHAARSDSR
jgi:hypothetical protein